MELLKYCFMCKTDKPISDFPKNRSTKDGLHSNCRVCNAEYFQRNKEKVLARQKTYYEENKTEILAKGAERRAKKDKSAIRSYNQEYRERNREQIKEKKKQRYQENKKEINATIQQKLESDPVKHEKRKAYLREYHRKNREKLLARHKEYWQETRDERNKKQREYQKAHPESVKASKHNRKARIRGNGGTFRSAEWLELKALYNNTCLCCGRVEPEIKLVPDHIIPLALGGKNLIENIQPLCQPCNQSKGVNTTDYRPNYNKPS